MKVKIRISKRALRVPWTPILGVLPAITATLLQLTAMPDTPAQNAWRLADQARQQARAGRMTEALEGYRQAIEVAPKIMEIRRDYATALGWAGKWQAASEEFERVFEAQPEQPLWALQEMANAHFFGGGDEAALKAFDRLIAAGQMEEPILTRRGLTLLRLDRPAEAETQYRQALRTYPESETAAVGLARSMLRLGRPEDAYFLAVSWGADAEPDSEIRAWQAQALTALGRYEEALAIYAQLAPERFEEREVALSRDVAQAQTAPPAAPEAVDPESLTPRERGVRLARAGEVDQGLAILCQALSETPDDLDLRRDYAVVLNWAERYSEALEQFDALLAVQPEQPTWVRQELAQAQLFGDRLPQARETLEELIADGVDTLAVRSKLGLALRWLERSEEASAQYREIVKRYPESIEGYDGLTHSLADRNRLGDAIETAEKGLERVPDAWRLQTTLAQVLNWSGLHVRAEKTLQALPPEYAESEDALRHYTLAARWSNQPSKAFEWVNRYRRQAPSNPDSQDLYETLKYEYGGTLRGEAEAVGDSLGYSYFGTKETFELALSPAHRLNFAHGRRRFDDRLNAPGSQVWNRYGLGWSGALGKRVRADAQAGAVDYANLGRRFVADASVSALLTDRVSVAGGVGRSPAETMPALQQRLTSNNVWSEVAFKPTLRLNTSLRYGRLAFEDASTRQTAQASAFYTLSRKGGHTVRVGGRSEWLWHDQPSELMWSPAMFHTQVGSVHVEGRLPQGLDYVAEVGAGMQRERGQPPGAPIIATLEVAKRFTPYVWLRAKGGYSNSSVGRLTPGQSAYQFRYASVGLDFRFGGPG